MTALFLGLSLAQALSFAPTPAVNRTNVRSTSVGPPSRAQEARAAPTTGAELEASDTARAPAEPRETPPNFEIPLWHDAALLGTMRVGAAILWPRPFADLRPQSVADSYAAAYTQPPRWDPDQAAFEWDGDAWGINVIGHALFGSELYLRARTCRHSVWAALAFSAGGSVAWEYVIEANAVRPSALDLVYTPVAGALFGEARYFAWRSARGLKNTLGSVLSALLDPLGELERSLGSEC